MTARARIAIIVIAAVGLVVAFVAARGSVDDNDDSASTIPVATAPAATSTTTAEGQTTTEQSAPAAPAVPVIRVVDAKPQGGIKKLEFSKGDRIRFTVKSDTADEIHVHGYDFHEDVAAGGSATFSFAAKIDGRFVVELENHATQIAELEVNP